MAKRSRFAHSNEFDKHISQDAIVAHGGGKRFFVKKEIACFSYTGEIPDDGSITLRDTEKNMHWVGKGWIVASKEVAELQGEPPERVITDELIEAWADFLVDGNGDVILINSSDNVVANSDTDGKLCIGTSSSQEPLVIKNRLGIIGAQDIRKFNLMLFNN